MNYLKNIDFSMGYGYSIYIRLYINLLHVSNIRKNEVGVSLSCKKIYSDVMENPQNVTKNRGRVRLDPLGVRLNFEILSPEISFSYKGFALPHHKWTRTIIIPEIQTPVIIFFIIDMNIKRFFRRESPTESQFTGFNNIIFTEY